MMAKLIEPGWWGFISEGDCDQNGYIPTGGGTCNSDGLIPKAHMYTLGNW